MGTKDVKNHKLVIKMKDIQSRLIFLKKCYENWVMQLGSNRQVCIHFYQRWEIRDWRKREGINFHFRYLPLLFQCLPFAPHSNPLFSFLLLTVFPVPSVSPSLLPLLSPFPKTSRMQSEERAQKMVRIGEQRNMIGFSFYLKFWAVFELEICTR